MNIIDLVPEFVDSVRSARTSIDFKARFWTWLEAQRELALAPLLEDMTRLWSGVGSARSLDEARAIAHELEQPDRADRVGRVGVAVRRFAEVAGHEPDNTLVLFAGLGRPEGYSRFDRGKNTLFFALDHPNSLAHADHLHVIVAHELCHAIRDPAPDVLADYGGWPQMSHDDFVARHPFREHLVSEALACAISERAWPGLAPSRYVYFDPNDYAWCEQHRGEIAQRMLRALAEDEDYRTFYARGSVSPGSPDCCDYYFGLHLARFALAHEDAERLLTTPAAAFLDRFLAPFVEAFTGTAPPVTVPAAAQPPSAEPLALSADVRRFYADLGAAIAARPEIAARDAQALEAAVAAEGLEYAGVPYAVCPFPIVLAAEEVRYLRWVAEHVLLAIEKVIALYREDAEVRAYFGFPEHVDRLARMDPGYRPLVAIGRFDAYWNGKEVRFLELNTNGAATITLADRLGSIYAGLEHSLPVVRAHGARPMAIVAPLVATIADCWHQAARSADRERSPRIAIVDWADLPTASELRQLATELEAAGMPAVVADPRDLVFDGARLRASGEPIDVVYRRLTLVDLLGRAAELEPLFAACEARAVVPIGSFAADIAHSKRTFAVLTHERWRERFSMTERALIDAHVPWTRMFRPGSTLWGGGLRELRELAVAERERFVLKPAEGQEGRDVVLGVETSQAKWQREVDRRYGGQHVLQERIEAPVREVLVPHDGGFRTVPMHLHVGEFVFGGSFAGFLLRASKELVLSARSDDRTLPALILGGDPYCEPASDLEHP